MKKLGTMVVLAGSIAACGGDDSDGARGAVDAGLDGAVHVGTNGDGGAGPKVEHAGAMCTVATAATACGGSDPVCASTTWAFAAYPGNHCEATCTTDAECGSNGACPIGRALANPAYGSAVVAKLQTTKGVCYQKCTVGSGTNDGCRSGYTCKTIAQSFNSAEAQAVAELANGSVCLPENGLATLSDAGVRDAGATVAVDGGLDGGR